MAGRIDPSLVHGKIQWVDLFPDFKVKIVTTFGDLLVQQVERRPNGPGKWQMVRQFPDFRIKLVDHFPDFTIQYVQAFPRVRR